MATRITPGLFHSWEKRGEMLSHPKCGDVNPLRFWQKEAYDLLKDEIKRMLKVPTGAGKSFGMEMFALKDAADGYKSIFIVPQRVIGSNIRYDYIDVPDLGPTKFNVLDTYNLTNTKGKTTEKTKVATVIKFLKSTSDNCVITHSLFVSLQQYLANNDQMMLLNKVSLFVDESHHLKDHTSITNTEEEDEIVETNGLGHAVTQFEKLPNIKLTLVTATPFRSDGMSLLSPELMDKFVVYSLAWDRWFEHMNYLKSFAMNIALYNQHPTDVIKSYFNDKDDFGFNLISIPHTKQNMYSRLNTTPVALLDDIFVSISTNEWELVEDAKYKYWMCYTSKGIVRVADLVYTRGRDKVLRFIDDHKSDIEKGPNFVIAMGVFMEGADYPLLERAFIIDERSSYVAKVQIVGRILRDVGLKDADGKVIYKKEHTEVIEIFPEAGIQTDFLDRANANLNGMMFLMLMEEIINPTKRVTSESPGKRANYKQEISTLNLVGDEATFAKVWTQVIEKLVGTTTSDSDCMEVTKEAIAEVLNNNDLPTDEDTVTPFYNRFVRLWYRKVNLADGLDCGEAPMRLLKGFNVVEGIKQVLSDKMGTSVFKEYRNWIQNDRQDYKHIRWTHKAVKHEAAKYQTYLKFYEGSMGAYSYAVRNKILDDICSHMVARKKRTIHTHESVKHIALSCKTLTEFNARNGSAYKYALRNKIMNDVCSHMEASRVTHTHESVKTLALPYQRVSKFQAEHPGAYQYAFRNKIMNDVCSHMVVPKKGVKKIVKKRILNTHESVKILALPYMNRRAFRLSNASAYQYTLRHKILNDVCGHMTT